KKRLNTVSHCT
ncbi:histone deacetylase domain protein, partial [Vibrio parahaemolyticus EKP-028]